MTRGPKKHLKRLVAPKHWMMDKLGGIYAPRPTPGPHKKRECLPLMILIRNRLKYALTMKEVTMILKQRLVQVDNKVRTDNTFPCGFMDTITIDKVKANYRLLMDVKGRFTLVAQTPEDSKFKLCKVKRQELGPKGIPYVATTDARTFRYVDPKIQVHDTVKVDLATGRVVEYAKFEVGNICMTTGGKNAGRVGIIENRAKHPGSYEIVNVKDANGHSFSTRAENVFVIGVGAKSWVTLPKDKGIRKTLLEEAEQRRKKN